jgi:hypothetical protein
MDNMTVAAHAAQFSPALLETVKTWVTYVGVLATAVIVAFAGIRKALRDLSKAEGTGTGAGASADHPGASRIVAATLMETTTLLMWSESNRDVVDSNRAMIEAVQKLTNIVELICDRFDTVESLKAEAVELRHQIERLRDRL